MWDVGKGRAGQLSQKASVNKRYSRIPSHQKIHTHNGIALLYTWNNIASQLYTSIKKKYQAIHNFNFAVPAQGLEIVCVSGKHSS